MGRANLARRLGLGFEQCEPRIALSGDVAATTFNFTLASANLEGGFVAFDNASNGIVGQFQFTSDGTNVIVRDGVIVNGIGTNGGPILSFQDFLNPESWKPSNYNSGPVGIPAPIHSERLAKTIFELKRIPAPSLTEPSDEGGNIDLAKVPSGGLNDVEPGEQISERLLTTIEEEPKESPNPAMIPEGAEAKSLRGRAVLMEVAAISLQFQPREVQQAVVDCAAEAPISLHSPVAYSPGQDRETDEAESAKLPTESKVDLASVFPLLRGSESEAQTQPVESSPRKPDRLGIANSTSAARDHAFAEMEETPSLVVAAAVSDPKSHTLSGLAVAAAFVAVHTYRGLRGPAEVDPVEQSPPRRSRRIRDGTS